MTHPTFTPFPPLTTERLTLRQLSLNDDHAVFALRSDSNINQYLGRQPSRTVEDARKFIGNITEAVRKDESIYWAITLPGCQTFVGTICLFDFSGQPPKCEIGYELLTQFQGKGIMLEAASKAVEYAVQTVKVQTIEAYTHQHNRASTKLLEKLGFKQSPEPDKGNPDFYVWRYGK